MNQPPTTQRTYHGDINPEEMADVLVAAFNQGNMQAQQIGQGDKVMVQIATRQHAQSGGKAALSVTIQKIEDGVSVALGQHAWLGAAASLGQTALGALANPWSLLGRLDEELSCANSRFFRTVLYANAEISAHLREHFVLHWQSVRPVPRISSVSPVKTRSSMVKE